MGFQRPSPRPLGNWVSQFPAMPPPYAPSPLERIPGCRGRDPLVQSSRRHASSCWVGSRSVDWGAQAHLAPEEGPPRAGAALLPVLSLSLPRWCAVGKRQTCSLLGQDSRASPARSRSKTPPAWATEAGGRAGRGIAAVVARAAFIREGLARQCLLRGRAQSQRGPHPPPRRPAPHQHSLDPVHTDWQRGVGPTPTTDSR